MRRVIAMFFVLLLVSTNVGLALGTHFCGGYSMDTKLVNSHDDLTCGMEFVKKDCHDHDHRTVIKKACCSNEIQSLQIESEFAQVTMPAIPVAQAVILISFLVPEFHIEQEITQAYIPDASPPWQPQDVQITYQSFII